MASDTYHEALDLISEHTKNVHRGIVSLMEELEAIDWYQQRADATTDEALKAVLLHNMREEIEHAMMNLEWIRRVHPVFDANMRIYLFTDGPITEVEAKETGGAGAASEPKTSATRKPGPATAKAPRAAKGSGGSLGIGGLRGKPE